MINNYYDEAMVALKTEVDSACSNIDSNPSSALKNEVDDVLNQLKEINFVNWNDSASQKFLTIISSASSKLSEVSSSISSSFANAESIYKSLKSELEMLQKDNDTYRTVAKDKPNVANYYETNPSTGIRSINNTKYSSALASWKEKVHNLETICKMHVDNINNCINKLNAINGS